MQVRNTQNESGCLAHMQANGIPFDGPLECDGVIHRFSRDSKRNQPDEWYICSEDTSLKGIPYLICTYGTWSGGGEKFTYRSYEANTSISHEERLEIQKREEERKKRTERLLKEDTLQRTKLALDLWEQSIHTPSLCGHNTYLEHKQVNAYGIKYRVERNGEPLIVVPIRNLNSELQAVQFIYEDGSKKFHGAKNGNFHIIGEIDVDSRIYVVEGYATGASVHEATKCPVVIAFDCGNLYPVIGNLRTKYPHSKIIIASDNDVETLCNPGKTKAEQAVKAYGCALIIPTFPKDFRLPNGDQPTDFNDLHVNCGIDEVVKQLQQAQQLEKSRCFQFRSAHSLIQEPPKVNWLIKSYIDTGSLSMLFGAPGSMKSFLAIDMGYCIATGRAWHGCPVRQSGPVFYIAGEGFAGLAKRFRAWSLAHDLDLKDVPFFSSDRPAQLLDQASAFEVVQDTTSPATVQMHSGCWQLASVS